MGDGRRSYKMTSPLSILHALYLLLMFKRDENPQDAGTQLALSLPVTLRTMLYSIIQTIGMPICRCTYFIYPTSFYRVGLCHIERMCSALYTVTIESIDVLPIWFLCKFVRSIMSPVFGGSIIKIANLA
jgi:hypothetical protein